MKSNFIFIGDDPENPEVIINVNNVSHILRKDAGYSLVMTNGHVLNTPNNSISDLLRVLREL